jgi:sigma54-dependent transcription regulator
MDLASIGGAYVRRRIDRAGLRSLIAGDTLTGDEVRALPDANRRALLSAGIIEVWPIGDDAKLAEALDCIAAQAREIASLRGDAPRERHLIHIGRGMYDVIEGVKLTPVPIAKDEAEELATRPV